MTTGEPSKKPRGVTFIAVFLGLLLIPVNVYWITLVEVRWQQMDGTCLPLFVTPIFILFFLTLANLLVRKLFRVRGLWQGELLTVYIMVVISSTLASHDLLQNLFGTIGHAYWFATPDNHWKTLFFDYLPKHLLVHDPETLRGFYQGGVNPWEWKILQHWLMPLIGWGVFLIVLIGMMLCMNIIIRKQWTENEKLVFPLIQLPLEMTSEESLTRFYKNKHMWAGFVLAVAIGTMNGLHQLFPSLPYIEWIKLFPLEQFVTTRPWNAIGSTQLSMYPFAIGIGYFIPLDLSFSCWFFYILRKVFQITGATFGWDAPSNQGFPFFDEQGAGAWLALAIVIIWGSRHFLSGVWHQAWSRQSDPELAREGRLFRLCFIGIAAGLVFLAFFSKYMGMSGAKGAYTSVLFFGIYFLLSIAITRIRAELGTPHEIYFVNPQRIMVSLLGVPAIGAANLTIISSMYWFNRGYRSHPMPNQLEAFKMSEGTGIRLAPLVWAIALATVTGLIWTYWANLRITYQAGAMAKAMSYKWWVGAESYDRLTDWLNNANAPHNVNEHYTRLYYFAGGFMMVLGLRSMRGAFIWWPFHPAGYALAVSYAMDYFWFPFFVSWLLKFLIIRIGGMKLHNLFIPFFLGLILGDFFIGSFWSILGPAMGLQTYRVFL